MGEGRERGRFSSTVSLCTSLPLPLPPPLPVNRNGCNYACQILFEVLFIVSTYKKDREEEEKGVEQIKYGTREGWPLLTVETQVNGYS